QARVGERAAIALLALDGGEDLLCVAEVADATVPLLDQVGDALPRPVDIGAEHDVGVDALHWTVHEHHADTGRHVGREIAVVATGWHDDHAVHPARAQRLHQLSLLLRVFFGRGGEQQVPVGTRRTLDGAGQDGVEGIGHVSEHQPDTRGPATAQDPGALVRAEAEFLDGRQHLLQHRGADSGLAVDHPRDGLQSDAGMAGHIVQRRPAGTPVHADNVISAYDLAVRQNSALASAARAFTTRGSVAPTTSNSSTTRARTRSRSSSATLRTVAMSRSKAAST